MSRAVAVCAAVLIAFFLCHGQGNPVEKSDSLINIAVLTLHNTDGVSLGEAEIISDRLCAEMFKTGGVHIMEREQMKAILAEQGFQQGVCSDEQCMVKMGRILGVQEILTGSIGKLGSLFLLNLRMIDVSTGRVQKVVSRDMNGMDVVVNNLPSISVELVNRKKSSTGSSGSGGTPPPPPPPNNAKPFKVGVRIGASVIPGETMLNLNRPSSVALNDAFSSIKSWPVSTPSLKVNFIIARYLSIEAGIGYSLWSQEFKLDITSLNMAYNFTEEYGMFSILTGIGGSIPVSIFRLNAGINLGYCFLNNTEDSKLSSQAQSTDFQYYLVKTNVSTPLLGAKAGVEILPTAHFGISFDVVFQYVKFSSAVLAYSTSSSVEPLAVELPGIGGVFGICYYF